MKKTFLTNSKGIYNLLENNTVSQFITDQIDKKIIINPPNTPQNKEKCPLKTKCLSV